MIRNIIHYEHTGSTNEDAKRLALEGACEGTVVVADSQSAGKGRRGREWASSPGGNLYFTMLLRPQMPADKAPMLTLLMATAVVRAMEETMGKELQFYIKWPNDIVINGKKVCGILTEMTMDKNMIQSVVIGVGVNINSREFPEELKDMATSLLLESEQIDGNARLPEGRELLNSILNCFESSYDIFTKELDLRFIKDYYEANLANKGKSVKVLEPCGEYEGRALGINDDGELLVETKDGSVQAISSGEVSVRGIYGYV